jgi:hypothetical protein
VSAEQRSCKTTDYIAEPHTSANRIVPDSVFILESREKDRSGLFFVEMDMGTERVRGQPLSHPDEDLPRDFSRKWTGFYATLNLPLMADAFIAQQQLKLAAALAKFDCGLLKNKYLAITTKKRSRGLP